MLLPAWCDFCAAPVYPRITRIALLARAAAERSRPRQVKSSVHVSVGGDHHQTTDDPPRVVEQRRLDANCLAPDRAGHEGLELELRVGHGERGDRGQQPGGEPIGDGGGDVGGDHGG